MSCRGSVPIRIHAANRGNGAVFAGRWLTAMACSVMPLFHCIVSTQLTLAFFFCFSMKQKLDPGTGYICSTPKWAEVKPKADVKTGVSQLSFRNVRILTSLYGAGTCTSTRLLLVNYIRRKNVAVCCMVNLGSQALQAAVYLHCVRLLWITWRVGYSNYRTIW